MTKVYRSGDEVYVERADSNDYFVIRPNSVTATIAYTLPGFAEELVSEDDVDTTSAYDNGYADGEGAGYTYDELEDARSEGYDEGYKDGKTEGYDDGYRDGKADAYEERDENPGV